MITALLILLPLLGTGCAQYEFDLTKPSDLAVHIGKPDMILSRSPFDYRLNAIEGRLVIRIYNTTDDPIQLLGDQSTVVDPLGQSHPLRGAAIASNSFIKLIFPPLGPDPQRSGPSIGLGFGIIAGTDRHDRLDDSFSDRTLLQADNPTYMYVVDNQDLYWNWDGETDIRVSLVFERRDQRFTQDFVFHRVKT